MSYPFFSSTQEDLLGCLRYISKEGDINSPESLETDPNAAASFFDIDRTRKRIASGNKGETGMHAASHAPRALDLVGEEINRNRNRNNNNNNNNSLPEFTPQLTQKQRHKHTEKKYGNAAGGYRWEKKDEIGNLCWPHAMKAPLSHSRLPVDTVWSRPSPGCTLEQKENEAMFNRMLPLNRNMEHRREIAMPPAQSW
eukprot:gene12749-8689_t